MSPIERSAGGGGGSSGAGTEIGYDQITATVNATGTTEGTATTIITCAAHTFDGAAVMAEFFSPTLSSPTDAAGFIVVGLFEAGALVNRLSYLQTPSGPQVKAGFMGGLRFTPSAGSHSYIVAAFVSSTTGTPLVAAGTGGPGANPPAWVRFTKV